MRPAIESKLSGAECPDGGTGRRARLKIWLSQGSAGSIPVLGTLIFKDLQRFASADLLLFYKKSQQSPNKRDISKNCFKVNKLNSNVEAYTPCPVTPNSDFLEGQLDKPSFVFPD